MGRYPLPAVPDGWYAVACGEGVPEAAGLRPLRCFARDLVLFRGEDGTARLFDAHCPHLGAHLGVGGRVCDDGLRCPFHGWRFDGDGRCVEVPGLDRRPPDVRVRSYPTQEQEGIVFAWFHALGAEPEWEPPALRPGGAAAWTGWTTEAYEVRTHVQDMGENILDQAHFGNVHDMERPDGGRFEVQFDGPRMIVEQSLQTKGTSPGGAVEVVARTVNSGPGLSETRVAFGPVETLTFLTHTPLDEEHVELRLHFCMRRIEDQAAMADIERMNRSFVNEQFRQDIPIWENKVYRERPPLTAVDGPIPDYRRWYRQFYSDWENTRRG